jgi:hypothetical protein
MFSTRLCVFNGGVGREIAVNIIKRLGAKRRLSISTDVT